ncbi:MAG: hypothetical protein EZS28_020161 [Streblomastix strix]|uniref:C2H2-type domain-containing protein n=1 Tax=Streblomastix strix TaxID=222440 RepID=A0A5J4VPU9_9EUKA|nr:MAG: hypothetical protein EZS28_020161 [Streblomastix strix]
MENMIEVVDLEKKEDDDEEEDVEEEQTDEQLVSWIEFRNDSIIRCPFCRGEMNSSVFAEHLRPRHRKIQVEILRVFVSVNRIIQEVEQSKQPVQGDFIEAQQKRIGKRKNRQNQIKMDQEKEKEKEKENSQLEITELKCPFCNKFLQVTQVTDHVTTVHKDNQSIYFEAQLFTENIELIQEQEDSDIDWIIFKQEKDIKCPICLNVMPNTSIPKHLKTKHNALQVEQLKQCTITHQIIQQYNKSIREGNKSTYDKFVQRFGTSIVKTVQIYNKGVEIAQNSFVAAKQMFNYVGNYFKKK